MLVRNDTSYLSDIFAKFNVLNLALQGNEVNLIKVKSAMPGFKNKLVIYQRNLARRDFLQFSSLQQLDTHSDCVISNADIDAHSKHLLELQADMEVRFQDVFQLEVPDWIIDPFGDITSEHGMIEEELVTLQSDIELKAKFRISHQSFWLQNDIKERYPHAWDRVNLFLLHFPAFTW